MSTIRKLLVGYSLVTLVLAKPCFGQISRDVGLIGLSINTPQGPINTGLVDLTFRIKSYWQWDSLNITVSTIGRLKYEGKKSWGIPVNYGDTIDHKLAVIISPDDTSGIIIEVHRKSDFVGRTYLYFVTTGDTVKVFRGKPKPPSPRPPDVGIPDSLLPGYGKPVVYTTERGYVDTVEGGKTHTPTDLQKKQILERKPLTRYPGQLIFVDGEPLIRFRGELLFQPADSTNYNDSVKIMKIGSVTDQKRKEIMEWAPLTKYDAQTIYVDGQTWFRSKGEYKFHRTESMTMDEISERGGEQWEKIRHKEIEIVMDLRDPDDYEYAKKLFGRLVPMEKDGFYHTTMTRQQTLQLNPRGIRNAPYPDIPGEPRKRNARRSANHY